MCVLIVSYTSLMFELGELWLAFSAVNIHSGHKSMETKGLKIHFQTWRINCFSMEMTADVTKEKLICK